MSLECICLQSRSSRCVFEPVRVARHQPGEHDVTIDVKFCGVCHSDVHVAKNDFLETKFPVVPVRRALCGPRPMRGAQPTPASTRAAPPVFRATRSPVSSPRSARA